MKNKIQAFFLCCLVFISLNGTAQICSGTINTVWQDDFGHGIPQLSLQTSPNITSGYTYENFGVNSGHYSLVNRFDYFSSWHLVPQDHSPADTGGYFLVIDGNSSSPVFYETIVRDICPFRQYSFSTFAMNIDLPAFASNQTFTFIISDTSGNQLATWDSPAIPVTDSPIWVPMGFSFTSGNNTALKLQARFNQTGYDDFAFDDFQFNVCGPVLNINTLVNNTCIDSIPLFSVLGSGYANPVYQWKKKNSLGVYEIIPGATFADYIDRSPSDSNTYSVTVGDGSLSCPIVESKDVNIKAAKKTTISNSICRGLSFQGYTTTGVYIDTFAATNGCDSIRTLSLTVNDCVTSIPCNNWLHTPSVSSSVNIGDLDITGNQVTVEAVINRTDPYVPGGLDNSEGDVVSKHNTPADVNYLLRPNHAWITTTDGFFGTPDICDLQLNKTYHVAMVYNGSTLKFYRDGFLMSQVNATGNLVLNNWNTRIGHYDPDFWGTQFLGYINEVRIWNKARTQAELTTYMNSSLPNPTTQAGLLAYYTFENLINKQGNTAFNGAINGNAVINTTNTSCPLIADSCIIVPTSTCNNWLHIPNYSTTDYVSIGDLDITGNKITVEASFDADTNYFLPSTVSYDLVSKHTDPSNANYLLRPVHVGITTTNGFFDILTCDYKPKKINHAALIYDGSTLKFYRNGFLMGSRPASGNLITNDLITKIGNYAEGSVNGALKGYINEVRIWNIARTETEIQTYMNASLPSPTTQPGLVAYYTFDNLNNKQGNAAWNGTLHGAATINNTIPDCIFIADSCEVLSVQQTCSGSLGEPVVNITFGSGAVNPGPQLPVAVTGASTNYNFASYATGNPPAAVIDGDYALVNAVPVNGAWHTGATDHTGNVNGYMAFFNSAPTPGEFYRQTVTNLCPGTTYEFAAWVANVINAAVLPTAVLPNITFNILDPNTQAVLATYNTGDIPHFNSMTWKQYSFLFLLPPGNSSVTLVLANNNIGGNAQPGNDLAIDDITFRPCGPLTNASFGSLAQIDSTAITSCTTINLFGQITGSFNSPSYQWQMSNDGGLTYTDLPSANALNAAVSNLSDGLYIFRLLSSEAGNINSSNCRFVSNLIKLSITNCSTPTGITCNNWLRIPNSQSYVTVGEIDIPGTQLTVEGIFSRDSALTELGFSSLNVVSKHWTPADVNYLLRVDRAQVTTTNGHFATPDICETVNKRIYHVAMTYDGTTLKFYRNGFLLSQIPCTGAMFQNNYLTTIAATANSPTSNTQLIGYLNEIRIWNVVKTQAQLQAYMNSSLPNPTTQPGLLGYYTFDVLTNKQGNPAYNATLHGNASINETIPDCSFVIDSCTSVVNTPGISSIINDYTPVTAFDPCTNKLTVDDATQYNPGDTVVLIQMKGADINQANNNSFGNITDFRNAGNYEFNYVKSKAGNTIELQNILLKGYDIPNGKVQLIRVPYFQTAIISDTLTCLPWDGTKGGVLVLNSATDLTMNAPIDVSRKGFRGGQVGSGYDCSNVNNWAAPTGNGGTKGEGIAEYIPGFEAGGARQANGGGGAYAANTGGGGGANDGAGGLGGQQYDRCSNTTQSIDGSSLTYLPGGKIYLGGGGGGGQQDNGQPVAAGGNGGGLVIIKGATLNSNNQHIIANGESVTTLVRDEGGAGGGGAGAIFVFVNSYNGNLSIEANGGDGSSNFNQIYPAGCHGPGGGGGGGFVGFSSAALPASVTLQLSGGKAGLVLNPASACFNTTHGASGGGDGTNGFNFTIPESTLPFKKNIDSVKIKDSSSGCKSFDFKGLAFTNTTPIRGWQWIFDDGATSFLQDVSHSYTTAGAHNVKLVVTDDNGCRDSAVTIVNSAGINFDFTFEQDVCNPLSVQFKAIGDTTANIFWSLGDGTVINNIRNPLHVFADTGYYLVQYSTGNGNCRDTVKKTILISYRNANIILTPDTTICFNTSKLLRSNIDSSLNFCWSPANFLNSVNLANPATNTPSTITYTLVAAVAENNLVTNGDFSSGNTGFSSDYAFTGAGILSPGQYEISNSSSNAGIGSVDCRDHTSGAGNMLIANSDAGNKIIWRQQVNLLPNTSYVFSIWMQSVNISNNVQLQLSINGNTVLDGIRPPLVTCNWKRYFITWNSGSNTTAQIAILDKTSPNTINGIDNFAIDDISFSAYSIKKDSVTIKVDTPFVNTNPDTSVCESSPVLLNTTGAATYSWSPAAGLSNAAIGNPIAAPDTTTKYIVTGTNTFGCMAKDSLTITVNPKPIITLTGNGDTLVCRNTTVPLFATGGVTYLWSPANTLNNPNIPNPVARPTADTVYFVKVTGANNCINSDSVNVKIRPIPTFTVSPNKSGCLGTSPQLNATGGNYYLWSPASLISDPNISNPVATTGNTTVYSVIIRETTCNDSTALTTTVTILPLPTIEATKSNDINCSVGSAILTAAGGFQYSWSPAAGLNDRSSASPVANPGRTTLYTVTGTDNSHCSNTDTITVIVDFTGKATYLMPNAFSPNGDGVNDCYRIKYFGLIQELHFVIYNRWGNMVFSTSNPDDCWDGTYKANPAEAGNYVYYIKAKTACGPVERKGNLILVR